MASLEDQSKATSPQPHLSSPSRDATSPPANHASPTPSVPSISAHQSSPTFPKTSPPASETSPLPSTPLRPARNASTTSSSPSTTSTASTLHQCSRRPFHADHYPDTFPFTSSSEEVGDASPYWLTAMRAADYPPEEIDSRHYFTKSVTYYPDWKLRVISKNEHFLDIASNKIHTRERWAMCFYYGGGQRDSWDELVAGDWDGKELDAAKTAEEVWIEVILMVTRDAIAKGRDKDRDGFQECMVDLIKAVDTCEEILRKVDKGGPTSKE